MKNLKEIENEYKESFDYFITTLCKNLKLPIWFLDPKGENKTDEN